MLQLTPILICSLNIVNNHLRFSVIRTAITLPLKTLKTEYNILIHYSVTVQRSKILGIQIWRYIIHILYLIFVHNELILKLFFNYLYNIKI